MPTPLEALITWLDEQRLLVVHLENNATLLLYEKNDTSAYQELMRKKALVLQKLSSGAEQFYSSLSLEHERFVRHRVEQFSQSARNALQLDSVFYMSALLYPENHQPGEPNDLDDLLAALAKLS